MRRSSGLVLFLAGGVIAASGVVAPAHAGARSAASAGDLTADIDQILTDSRLAGATVGVLVRDASTGEVLYARNADGQETPASNNKLETTAAAFGILGAGYRFRTAVYRRGGTLYLKGTGDPTMRGADYDRLAASVADRGVTKVTGDLVADDTWFDAQRVPADWDPTDLPYSYAAETSALTVSPDDVFDEGSVGVNVTPGVAGEPVKVELSPMTSVVTIDNRATTGPAGSASTLSVDRTVGTNTIVITGSYPAGAARSDHLATVHDPTLYAADVFRRALAAHGVEVAGTTRHGRTPRAARVVAGRRSIPLSELATPYLKLSNNPIAETLVKAIGRKARGKGTWPAGLAAISAYLRRLGVDTTQVKQTDGSGLSHGNRTTPAQLTKLLKAAQRQSWYPLWYNALPIAGQADPLVGGTLASRMRGTPAAGNVHAKTGTLTGATALSGYVTDSAGRRLIFSSIFNGYRGGAPKDLEDRIAVRLAGGPATAATVTFGRRLVQSGSHLECSWTGSC